MQIVIDNRVRIAGRDIGSKLAELLVQRHTYHNPEYAAAKARAGRWKVSKKIPQYLKTYTLDDRGMYAFPRGSWPSVKLMLEAEGLRFTVSITKTMGDQRLRDHIAREPFQCSVAPRSYQVDQLEVGRQNPTCLWRSPCGSGKTTACILYLAQLQLPTIVVVPNTKLLEQWIERCVAELGLRRSDVGVIQGATKSIRPVTIAMAPTLYNCVDQYRETFGVFVADEVHLHAAKTFSEVSDRIRAYYRLGVSADERRADGKEFLVYDIFGPVRHQVTKQELIESNNVMDVEIRIIPTETTAPWYQAIRGAKKATGPVQTKLQNELATNEARTSVIRKVLGWCMDGGSSTAMLAWRREHVQALYGMAVRAGHQAGLMLGGDDDKHEFEHALRELNSGSFRCVAGTYQAIGTGFDVPRLERGIFAAPCANSVKAGQQVRQYAGRFERPYAGKQRPIIYYIWDRQIFGDRPVKNLKRWFTTVSILHDGAWVTAREFLKTRPDEVQDQDSDFDDDMFASPEYR